MKRAAYYNFYEGGIFPLDDEDRITTSNNSATSIKEVALPENARGYMLVSMIAIYPSDPTKGLTGKKFVHWTSSAGVATVEQADDYPADVATGGATATWTVDASGGNLRIRVTGESATDIEWSALHQNQYQEYEPLLP